MIPVKAFDAYKTYIALKLHFTSEKYDYIKSKGVVRANVESFERRNDRYKFQKLAKINTKESLEKLLIANLLNDNNIWIGDLLTQEAKEIMLSKQKTLESLKYIVSNDLDKLFSSTELQKLFSCKEGRPDIIKAVMRNEITIETFIILEDKLNFNKLFNKKLKDDIVWQEFHFKSQKYKPFFKYDKDKMFKLVKEKYNEHFTGKL